MSQIILLDIHWNLRKVGRQGREREMKLLHHSPPAEVGPKLVKITCYPSFTHSTSLAKLVTLKKSGFSFLGLTGP